MVERALIEAPSALGLRARGVELLPQTLRRLGLVDRLKAVASVETVPMPQLAQPAVAAEIPETTLAETATDSTAAKTIDESVVLNAGSIRAFSLELARHVAAALDRGRFPLILGGDCSILLGTALALRRRGRYGLAFLDGHADFYSPEAEPSGEVASMELAIATGREPAQLADIDGLRPYLREQDVVVLGVRDTRAAAAEGSPDIRQTAIHVMELSELRQVGLRQAARQSIEIFEANGPDGFWIHLDADVLHDELMPAVDYRLRDGLWADELTELLAILLASPMAAGLEITIYNPLRDDTNLSAGRLLVDVIADAFDRA